MNREQKIIFRSFIPPLLFVAVLWVIKIAENYFRLDFSSYGVLPGHISGLIGILTSPLIHADYEHLISNSIPLLVLGAGLIYFYRQVALRVFVFVYLLSGLWLWLGGRENYHIGASGVVYGLVTFLFFSGLLRKHTGLMALSLLMAFLYGGFVWGILPIYKVISWEAHLFGSLAGIVCAVWFKNEGLQQKKHEWKPEDDTEKLPYDILENEVEQQLNAPPPIIQEEISAEEKERTRIHYIYKKQHNEYGKGEQSD